MTDWMFWLALAAIVVMAEMFLGTFYLLMIGLGLGCGAIAALLGMGMEWQVVIAGATGALATFALRRRRGGRVSSTGAQADPNVNLDIGQVLLVEQWITTQQSSTARVMYRGAMWDVDLVPGQAALPGRYQIREVRGNRFLVVAA